MNKSLIKINIAVLLFGLAGLFAKGIGLPSILITFGRVFVSSITLFIYTRIKKMNLHIDRYKGMLILSGFVLALHWWSFLESIQRSTVAIGTITFSTFPLFVMLIEIVFLKEKLHIKSLICILLIMAGVFITIPEFSIESYMVQGIIIGMMSSLCYAILTICNKVLSKEYESTLITFYEQSIAAIVLLPSIFLIKATPSYMDIGLIILLGICMTAFAHTLFVDSLKEVSARLAGILSSNESVYSILFAFILLHEIPTLKEIIGGLLIFIVVLYSQLQKE